jgi:hypothetical protein
LDLVDRHQEAHAMKKLDPRELYEIEPDLPDLSGAVLVQALDGFVDAGAAKRLSREHLLLHHGGRRIVTFDVDQLLDYRARRPPMVFAKDHWESYADPELAVHLLHDAAGTPFLLLAGPEPDAQWERFVEAVRLVVDQLGVRLTVGLNAIPMAVPHTRPLTVIGHGSRPELAGPSAGWVDTVQVPATAGHLLEHRLAQAGNDAAGYAVAVPHYLAETELPAATSVLLDSLSRVSGLDLPQAGLAEQAAAVRARIDEQVEQSTEVAAVVRALEEQYDRFLAGRDSSLLADDSALPTADELGAELEQFLAQQTPPGEGPAL